MSSRVPRLVKVINEIVQTFWPEETENWKGGIGKRVISSGEYLISGMAWPVSFAVSKAWEG